MALQIQPTDIQYGDVYWAQVMNYGSGKPRPWLIISPTESNRGEYLEAIPSSTIPPHTHPDRYVEIQLPKSNKLSYFKCAHRIKLEHSQLGEFIIQLSQKEMNHIQDTIAISSGPLTRPETTIPPVHINDLPPWSEVTKRSADAQVRMLSELLNLYGIKALTQQWGVHHQAIYARINKLGQKMNANKDKPTQSLAPVSVSAEVYDLEADMLGQYIIKLLDPKKKYHIKLKEL